MHHLFDLQRPPARLARLSPVRAKPGRGAHTNVRCTPHPPSPFFLLSYPQFGFFPLQLTLPVHIPAIACLPTIRTRSLAFVYPRTAHWLFNGDWPLPASAPARLLSHAASTCSQVHVLLCTISIYPVPQPPDLLPALAAIYRSSPLPCLSCPLSARGSTNGHATPCIAPSAFPHRQGAPGPHKTRDPPNVRTPSIPASFVAPSPIVSPARARRCLLLPFKRGKSM